MQYAVAPTEGLLDPVYQFEGDANVWSDWRKTVTLVKHLTRRHLAARYRGSALGFVWSLLNPMLLMGVYTFVFTFIFRTSAPGRPLSGVPHHGATRLEFCQHCCDECRDLISRWCRLDQEDGLPTPCLTCQCCALQC